MPQRGQQGGATGLVVLYLALLPGLKRFRNKFEREGVETFVYMDGMLFGLMGVTTNAI